MSLIVPADPKRGALAQAHCTALRNRVGDLVSYTNGTGKTTHVAANDYCEKVWKTFFDHGLENGQNALQLTAGGQINGIIIYGPSATNNKLGAKTAEISYLEVIASGSGHGHRRSLVMHALTDLFKRGYKQVLARTSPENGDHLEDFFSTYFSPAAISARKEEQRAPLPVTPQASARHAAVETLSA
jgi:ribosomal protein S18 acetylase RimI-like enzyme